MPEVVMTYFQQYYRKHRGEIAARRQRRYETDDTYREEVKQRSRQRYRSMRKQRRGRRVARVPRTGPAQRINPTDNSTLFSVGAFAVRIDRNIKTINKWERNKVLPPPTLVDDFQHRWYAEAYMDQVAALIKKHQSPKGYIRQDTFKPIVQAAFADTNGTKE